jgi:hypothetical protein
MLAQNVGAQCQSLRSLQSHVAGFNLGILMRALFGCGTPKEAAGITNVLVFVIPSDVAGALVILAIIDVAPAVLVSIIAAKTH